MPIRENINELAESNLSYFDPSWDKALLGFVERAGDNRYVAACYGYQAMKAILKDKGCTPQQIYVRLGIVRNSMRDATSPIILTRSSRRPLWRIIREENYPIWDTLNKAILGLGYEGNTCGGVVYNKPLCTSLLQEAQSTNNDNATMDYAQALHFLDESIIPVSLGKYTPWFLTPVK